MKSEFASVGPAWCARGKHWEQLNFLWIEDRVGAFWALNFTTSVWPRDIHPELSFQGTTRRENA